VDAFVDLPFFMIQKQVFIDARRVLSERQPQPFTGCGLQESRSHRAKRDRWWRILAWASSEEFLAHHLELAAHAKSFWKDWFFLYTLWAMGGFCGMIPHGRGSAIYPYTWAGFYQFLRDHGSQISADEASRPVKVFSAYNRFGVTIPALQEAYPQSDGRRRRGSTPKEELRRAAERRAVRLIAENENGMIGDPRIFIPRQYRQHAEDELRAEEVFDIAMRRLGTDNRDAFFMRVVELVAKTWLTKDDRQAVEQLLSEQRYFDRAPP
jgi:hypothetical protein